MSLPTPPKSSHREKENYTHVDVSRGVVWAECNQYHSLSTSPKGPACKSAMMERPVKSILKPTQPLLPLIEEERETTPEPSNPLHDPKYLETPVLKIISKDSTMTDLIAAYSILTARMRPRVTEYTDCSCPLFEPLNNHRDKLCYCITQHIGRALEDPVGEEEEVERSLTAQLPSPMKSPKKKRGMTAEQAKYARDLCTLSQSVLKFLGLFLTLPLVSRTFTDKQLGEILTALLSIPLAKELPTPNARKTCALSICVLQTQRLPSTVLMPARNRIAHALCRGIDGELGKEGKKGSASDGLKAIHDLALYQPLTFVPAFVIPLESILNNLLAPTLALRAQACHALGGLVLGSISVPLSVAHTRLSSCVTTFLLTVSSRKSPTKKEANAVPVVQESPICRTLRTTLNSTDPVHVAQGPVWALSVLASFIVLLGSALYTDARVSRTISNLLSLTMRHKKSSVRALACIVWRSLVWAWFQPLLPTDPDNSETEDSSLSKDKERLVTRQAHWKLMQSVLTMGVGASLVGAFVGNETDDNDLKRVFYVLNLMVRKNAETRADAMVLISQLVSSSPSPMSWDVERLLPKNLFSACPGLLTADFKMLQNAVRAVFEELPSIEDTRSLTQEELAREGVLDNFFKLWRIAFLSYGESKDSEVLLMDTWSALLKAALSLAEEEGDEGEARVIKTVVNIINDSLSASINYDRTPEGSSQILQPNSSNPSKFNAQNLRFIHELWVTARSLICHNQLDEYEEQLLAQLMKNEEEMTENGGQSRVEWSLFCADLVLACDEHGLKTFWGHQLVPDAPAWSWNWSTDIRSSVWAAFVHAWQKDSRGTWTGMLLLLTLPFSGENAWDMTNADLGIWESFFEFTINKAFDFGYDALTVVDHIVQVVTEKHDPTFTSLLRVADILMANIEMENLQELPESLVEFVTDTLRASYPPEPRNLQASLWMIRTLNRVVQACPVDLLLHFLGMLQDGLAMWILDEYSVMSEDQYTLDVVTLYENLLLAIRSIPESQDTLEKLSCLFEAAFLGRSKPPSVLDAFDDFWKNTSYSRIVPCKAWPVKVQEYFNGREGNEPIVATTASTMTGTPFDHVFTSTDDASILVGNITSLPTLVIAPALASPCSRSSPLLPPPTILSTPPKGRRCTSSVTPPRPHKTPTFNPPMYSPTTPSGTSKQPAARALSLFKPCSPSSPINKRRRLENKENESPRSQPQSPAVHPLVESPHSLSRVLAPRSPKRRWSDGGEFGRERPAKRVRVEAPIRHLAFVIEPRASKASYSDGSSDSEGSSASDDVFSSSKTSRPFKKRKAILMDAVEIPVMRHSRSSYRSFEKLKVVDHSAGDGLLLRRALTCTDNDVGASPEIPEMLELGSDDSMRQTSNSSPRTPTQLSSDDDPHVGQVTPHHLLSPALRRAPDFEDPPSDDSTGPASPSKDVLKRRLQRVGSADTLYHATSLRHLLKS